MACHSLPTGPAGNCLVLAGKQSAQYPNMVQHVSQDEYTSSLKVRSDENSATAAMWTLITTDQLNMFGMVTEPDWRFQFLSVATQS